MGPLALLPLRRKACWGFFRPEKSEGFDWGLNPLTWVLEANTEAAYGQSVTETGFLRVLLFTPVSIISSIIHTHSFMSLRL
jgi:hypothetical protein